jgi:16S rRNA (cytidine1402-2'-O)-methyltransferase
MLYIVATPIGHYSDITLRGRELLSSCDFLIGEERRVASTLLKKLGLEQKEIYLLNEHTKKDELKELVDLCAQHTVALISDCGTPGFSDPGADLVAACRARQVKITTLPGASSLMGILSLSSQKLSEFLFLGFLPAKNEERVQKLKNLKTEKLSWVIMDTPYRLKAVLTDLATIMPNERGLLAMNLTQESETILEGTCKELLTKCVTELKIEEAEFMFLRYGSRN